MKKMNSPELEVIHFNTEDVIVTSGVGYKSLSPGRSYFTLGYEMDEAFPDAEVFSKKNFYKLYYDIEQYLVKNGVQILANKTCTDIIIENGVCKGAGKGGIGVHFNPPVVVRRV